jgi:hypothetical protein
VSEQKTALELAESSNARDANLLTLREATPYSPQRRHLYPKLIIVDDDTQEIGECIRIRKLKLTIGRKQCDLMFPAESMMSACHVVLSLQEISKQKWAWVLEDNQSGNGLFVRLREFAMFPGMEFLMGGTRIQIHGDRAPTVSSAHELDPIVVPFLQEENVLHGPLRMHMAPYALIASERTHVIEQRSITIGSSPSADVLVESDPFIESVHAKIQSDGKLKWKVYDVGKMNGIWLRITRMVLSSKCQFMAGEQRFLFELPS